MGKTYEQIFTEFEGTAVPDTTMGSGDVKYHLGFSSEGSEAVQLLSRIWRIVDADGETSVVRGDGVIGQQPTLAAGATYEYSSYCPLGTRWGTMEGTYRFRAAATNAEFDVEVARFYLVAGTENQTASTKQ